MHAMPARSDEGTLEQNICPPMKPQAKAANTQNMLTVAMMSASKYEILIMQSIARTTYVRTVYSFINYACMDLQTLYGKMCASHQHELVNAKLEPQPSKRNTDQTDCAEL